MRPKEHAHRAPAMESSLTALKRCSLVHSFAELDTHGSTKITGYSDDAVG